jgi:hypothetical protein
LVIVNNSAGSAVILTAINPDSIEAKAAVQLQTYLQKTSGVKIPIQSEKEFTDGTAVVIGETERFQSPMLGKNEISIKCMNNQLLISGSDPMWTLYAVYVFLEENIGCRFYAPDYEFVPQSSEISIPAGLDYRYAPPITTRTVHSRLFYDNHDFANKRKVTYEGFPGYVPGAGVHTFHRFVPAEKYLKSHPEYFALRNGRRLPTQLCLTNDEALDIVIHAVDSLFKAYPNSDVISVSQDDNQQYCQCEHCMQINDREESPAGSMIEFVNKVAEKFPDKMISTLAYQYTRKAPKNIKPRENVLITLCSIECDRSGPINEKCKDFAEDLKSWGKLTTNIRIWDYTTQFTNFLAPFPNLHTLQPNIQLFKNNNAKWIFEQHSHQPSELFELRSYLTAKLLWNPDIDQELIVNDFLQGYYEEAAPFIQEYITTVHEELRKDKDFFLFLYGDPSQGFSSFLRPSLLNKYDSLYDHAEIAVREKPATLERVHRARLSVDYAILEAARINDPDGYSLTQTNDDGDIEISEDVRNRLSRFRETCIKSNITNLNEMRFSLDEYMENYEHTISKSSQQNIAIGKSVTLHEKPKKYANEDPQVLTDGAFGGASFYANWLGFEGNDLEAIIDLGSSKNISSISMDFLQVVNHVVFFPTEVSFFSSPDGKTYTPLGNLKNERPLSKSSKVNDIQTFKLEFPGSSARYIKVVANNMKTAPDWHHAAGLPSWIFTDEILVN